MKIDSLVINLDKRTDRIQHITNELHKHTISWSRIPAKSANKTNSVEKCIFESHIECWKIIEKRNDPAIVFEDDVVLCSKFSSILNELINKLPKEWELLHFHSTKCNPIKINDLIGISRLKGWGTHGYIITPSGATKLLKVKHSNFPLDSYMLYNCNKLVNVIPYVTLKNIIWQLGDKSDNMPEIEQSKFWFNQRSKEFF